VAIAAVAAGFGGAVGAAIEAGFQHGVTRLVHHRRAEPLSFSIRRDEEGLIVVGIPRDRAQHLAAVRDCKKLERKARAAGGADPRRTLLSMLVRGHLADTAVITGMRALVLSRTPVKEGAEAFCQGGGAEYGLRLRFDLDSEDPVALRMKGNEVRARPAGQFFTHGNVVTASAREAVPLSLEGVSTKKVVTWKILVTVDFGAGKTKTYVLPERGPPYRTSPQRGGRPIYEWRWFRDPPDLHIWKRP
jgi:hypothetical protein